VGAVFFSLLGMLLVLALSSTGTGAFLLSRFGRVPHDLVHDEHLAIPDPSAPPPATPAPTGA
ncbi:MAG TPA: hypothetical protein VLV15_10645, partial [Dongiaceae bacterium]|nr:hypothetical protein [Dongiaceae bacterium]